MDRISLPSALLIGPKMEYFSATRRLKIQKLVMQVYLDGDGECLRVPQTCIARLLGMSLPRWEAFRDDLLACGVLKSAEESYLQLAPEFGAEDAGYQAPEAPAGMRPLSRKAEAIRKRAARNRSKATVVTSASGTNVPKTQGDFTPSMSGQMSRDVPDNCPTPSRASNLESNRLESYINNIESTRIERAPASAPVSTEPAPAPPPEKANPVMTIQTVAPVPADTEQAMREAGFTEAQIPRLLKLPGGEPRCREVLAWLPYWQSDPRVGNAIALAMRAIEKPEAYRPPAGYLRARQQALTLLEEHKGGKKIPTPADTERLLQEHAREEAERAAKDAEFQAHLARERAFLDECDRKRALRNGTTG